MAEKYLGESIKNLGFGLMRLPMLGDEIDIEQTKRMVDTFMAEGLHLLRHRLCVHRRQERGGLEGGRGGPLSPGQLPVRHQAAPLGPEGPQRDGEPCSRTSLDRAGLEYYDFLPAPRHERRSGEQKAGRALACLGLCEEGLKEQGRAKHIGFSFHDTADALGAASSRPTRRWSLSSCRSTMWTGRAKASSPASATRSPAKYGKPVIIMEPVRGGSLAVMPPQVQQVVQGRRAGDDRGLLGHPLLPPPWTGVLTVLSGMSTEEQLNDNVSYMEDFKPLDEKPSSATVQQVVDILNSLPTIPCTACKYCVDGCPQKINIPAIFTRHERPDPVQQRGRRPAGSYANATKEGGKAGDCIQCGSCQAHCPQKIEIIETLKKAGRRFLAEPTQKNNAFSGPAFAGPFSAPCRGFFSGFQGNFTETLLFSIGCAIIPSTMV